MTNTNQQQIQQRAISYLHEHLPAIIAATTGSAVATAPPVLYNASGRPLSNSRVNITPDPVQYASRGASQKGSLRSWVPRKLSSGSQMSRQRQTLQARISDLIGSDPHAAGVVQSFPVTVVGSGLTPYPSLDSEALGITEEIAAGIESAQRRAWSRFAPQADITGRDFGQIQFVWERSLIQHGEALTLVLMQPRPGRRYNLCLRMLHPSRLATPTDKTNSNVFDGVEVDDNGAPVAAWIRKSGKSGLLSGHSRNFRRIPFQRGHRWLVIHDFYEDDPEQYRGVSPLTPILKGFKDLNDFLDAELVSNVVTAAFSIFIELQRGTNPMDVGSNLSAFYDDVWSGQKNETVRYQNLDPGSIMYGNPGEKPHPISANRPGTTFPSFVRELKKAFAHGLNIPYPVLFKDVDGVSHAGFRSAMLEAWRVYTYRRQHIGRGPSQAIYNMLQEEAYLMGDLPIPGPMAEFYANQDALCACEWYGAPKGDIEPYKAIKADLLKNENNIKPLEQIILEDGAGNPQAVIRQIEKEKTDLRSRGLMPADTQSGNDSELSGTSAAPEALSEALAGAVAERVVDEMEAVHGV
jgi:lambda family phage portal protein